MLDVYTYMTAPQHQYMVSLDGDLPVLKQCHRKPWWSMIPMDEWDDGRKDCPEAGWSGVWKYSRSLQRGAVLRRERTARDGG